MDVVGAYCIMLLTSTTTRTAPPPTSDARPDYLDPSVRGTVVPNFKRGDANASKAIDMADAIFMLTHLFAHGPAPSCRDAGDANDYDHEPHGLWPWTPEGPAVPACNLPGRSGVERTCGPERKS